ncbi:MAG: hypothetical protein GX119_10680 [Syntrophomonadaceae bacterium]|jgi:hypothetical protein|nr:hypothetical protein [Syntrophomonadaceae bacterium]
MTNFLPAGIINENLEEIAQRIDRLRALTQESSQDIQQEVQVLAQLTLELRLFISSFTCQPLIYTGSGSTEEIIKRLEWALAFSEEVDPMALFGLQKKTKRKASPK